MFAGACRGGQDGYAVDNSSWRVISHLGPALEVPGHFFLRTRQMSSNFRGNEERRRALRVRAGQTVHLRLGAAYCTGRAVNLSTDGALIEVDRLTVPPGGEVSLGFPSARGDETCWVVAVPCRSSDRMIGMHWRGQPPADVMLRIEAMIVRELDPLQPAEARLTALRARALAHDE